MYTFRTAVIKVHMLYTPEPAGNSRKWRTKHTLKKNVILGLKFNFFYPKPKMA